MKHTVVITDPAVQDIREAATYIAKVLKNPEAAERLLNDVEKAVSALSGSPRRHAKVDDPWLGGQGVRFFSVRNYIVFYVIREARRQVVILRFLYGRRDWLALVSGPLKKDDGNKSANLDRY